MCEVVDSERASMMEQQQYSGSADVKQQTKRARRTMGHTVHVAVATLNQWAMDFQGNLERILRSIEIAAENGAKYRTGPELEVSGYSCEDHFHEPDTYLHSWEVLLELMRAPAAQNMLIDVGMPVQHRNVAYNCRVAFYNASIVLVRPKMIMCDDGNYRETRWFSPWTKERQTEELQLPRFVALALSQETVPIGDAVIATRDTCLGYEICEELWNPRSKHIDMSLAGVEIIVNGSGSYMQLRKAHITTDLIRNASYKAGGAYLFANLRGCDGQRVYFNGCSAVALNGHLVARGRQFALGEVEVTLAAFDLQDVRAYRGALRSRSSLAASTPAYPRIHLAIELAGPATSWPPPPIEPHVTSPAGDWKYHSPEEEIALGPACWLWDYLRRSGQGGFFLPLSGGVDSSSTAIIVYSMCRLVVEAVAAGDGQVLDDCRKILAEPTYVPTNAGALCRRLLFTCYMGTENSSQETRARAALLAGQIRSHHLSIDIDKAVTALLYVFRLATGRAPCFRANGGCPRQNLALQNIQARTRMVLAYLFAQLMLWVHGRPGGLLVLGSANVDEALRGYMTKYDCSSADVNPIGGISKADLRRFLNYAQREFMLPVVAEIVGAPPTAELEPLVDGAVAQTDEQDMGLSYSELSEFGRLRKQAFCGPFSMFCKLATSGGSDPAEVADKVKHFFRCYAINRHKMTVLTPSYHAESYSPDDNRFDHRPFLYRANWTWQFRAIDAELEQLPGHSPQEQQREPRGCLLPPFCIESTPSKFTLNTSFFERSSNMQNAVADNAFLERTSNIPSTASDTDGVIEVTSNAELVQLPGRSPQQQQREPRGCLLPPFCIEATPSNSSLNTSYFERTSNIQSTANDTGSVIEATSSFARTSNIPSAANDTGSVIEVTSNAELEQLPGRSAQQQQREPRGCLSAPSRFDSIPSNSSLNTSYFERTSNIQSTASDTGSVIEATSSFERTSNIPSAASDTGSVIEATSSFAGEQPAGGRPTGDGQLPVASAGLTKSQSSDRQHSSVMGKIKDRAGVPV